MAEISNCLGVASLYLLRGITHEKTVISSQNHETLFNWVFAQQPRNLLCSFFSSKFFSSIQNLYHLRSCLLYFAIGQLKIFL